MVQDRSDKPKVSIVIPVYNRENVIVETVNCALAQTYGNIEIIIVDNCSTDRTWEILVRLAADNSGIRLFRNEENVGPVLNWKRCFEEITGEYGKILWSDDLISDDFIEDALKLFDERTAFVLTGVKIFNDDDNSASLSTYQAHSFDSKSYLKDILIYNRWDFPVSPGCALFRTSDLRRAFMIDIPNGEDLDFKRYGAGNDLLFFLVIASQYPEIKIVRKISAFFRTHSGSITVSKAREIGLYYEWSKWYFISTYYSRLKKCYKAKLFIAKYKRGNLRTIYRAVDSDLSGRYIFTILLMRALNGIAGLFN